MTASINVKSATKAIAVKIAVPEIAMLIPAAQAIPFQIFSLFSWLAHQSIARCFIFPDPLKSQT